MDKTFLTIPLIWPFHIGVEFYLSDQKYITYSFILTFNFNFMRYVIIEDVQQYSRASLLPQV